MDTDMPAILRDWEGTVNSLTWPDSATPHLLMDITPFGPTYWRTTTLLAIAHPIFMATLLPQVRRHLHGRQRQTLRHHTSHITARMEQARQAGKMGLIIRSVLQEEPSMFPLETLHVPGHGTITYHKQLHNMASEHFREWYARPPDMTVDWHHLLTSPDNFYHYTRAKSIPDPLAHLLWRAITEVPTAAAVRQELATHPHSLKSRTASAVSERALPQEPLA